MLSTVLSEAKVAISDLVNSCIELLFQFAGEEEAATVELPPEAVPKMFTCCVPTLARVMPRYGKSPSSKCLNQADAKKAEGNAAFQAVIHCPFACFQLHPILSGQAVCGSSAAVCRSYFHSRGGPRSENLLARSFEPDRRCRSSWRLLLVPWLKVCLCVRVCNESRSGLEKSLHVSALVRNRAVCLASLQDWAPFSTTPSVLIMSW